MGEHSAPKNTSTVSISGAFAAITGAIALTGVVGSVDAIASEALAADASASGILDSIAQCESGGNPSIVNASGHGGLFQFAQSTWRSVGGSGTPQSASVAEQYKRAAMLLARDGTGPWLASKPCWEGKSGASLKIKIPIPIPIPHTATSVPKAPVKPSPTPHPRVITSTPIHESMLTPTIGKHVVVKGDTLSEIAALHGISDYKTIFNKNRHIVSNPDLIFPGQVLAL